MYKSIIKPYFFSKDPEKAHYHAMGLLAKTSKLPFIGSIYKSMWSTNRDDLAKEVFGLRFKNPVGLAAGFDKDGRWIKELAQLGFGFIEVGTVTPLPQEGNAKPRLFRLPKDEAVINRMGFNNQGVDALADRLSQLPSKRDYLIGGNIGKNKVTPNEKAVEDYIICFKKLHHLVDYFVVNVSSPNTPGLRELQDKEPLTKILSTLQEINTTYDQSKPILLKIAPDLTLDQIKDIADIVADCNIAGVIATNTTISREGLATKDKSKEEKGGLSGKPVRSRSTEVIKLLRQKLPQHIKIIGVGGIQTSSHAKEKLEAGADLVQVYTGFIYEGPAIVKNILNGITQKAF